MKVSLIIAAAVTFSAATYAADITFTYSGTGSGSLNGTAFTTTSFTFTGKANTDNWVAGTGMGAGEYYLIHSTLDIDISGLGIYSSTTGTRTLHHPSSGGVYFISDRNLIDQISDAGLTGWDRVASFGPITDSSAMLSQWTNGLNTSGGTLLFDTAATSITFSATVGDGVPEPSSMLLLGAGLLSMSLFSARRIRGAISGPSEQSSAVLLRALDQ